MDLSFTPAELAFAREVRAWLADNVEVPPRFENIADEVEFGRRWQARLAENQWVGIHWPVEYGGRGAAPVEVAIFNMEYARSRALQPINRVGINLAGPTLLAHGTDEQKARWLPDDPQRARRSGASSSPSPTPAPTSRRFRRAPSASTTVGCSRARRCGRRTRSSPAGVSAWRAPTPTHPSTRASRISSST